MHKANLTSTLNHAIVDCQSSLTRLDEFLPTVTNNSTKREILEVLLRDMETQIAGLCDTVAASGITVYVDITSHGGLPRPGTLLEALQDCHSGFALLFQLLEMECEERMVLDALAMLERDIDTRVAALCAGLRSRGVDIMITRHTEKPCYAPSNATAHCLCGSAER